MVETLKNLQLLDLILVIDFAGEVEIDKFVEGIKLDTTADKIELGTGYHFGYWSRIINNTVKSKTIVCRVTH